MTAVAIAAWFGFLVPFFDLFNHFQALLIPGCWPARAGAAAFWGSRWQLPLAGFVLLGLLASAVTVVPETSRRSRRGRRCRPTAARC